MPFTFIADHENHILRSRADGVLSLADLLQYVRDRADAGVLDYDQIADMRGAEMRISFHDARVLASARHIALDGVRAGITVIIADHDSTFGVARMLEAVMGFEHIPFTACRDAGAAERCLATHLAARVSRAVTGATA